jgi:hypothetical protein
LHEVIGNNMNVIEFKSSNKPICFCFIDNTHLYSTDWSKELTKNQADYTISNIYSKGYDIYQSQNEDNVLKKVSTLGYTHAVVFSTGTEFINGTNFFDSIEKLISQDFLVAGHILDRKEAYYELHHQCYVINLIEYTRLGLPIIGVQEFGSNHTQIEPIRSDTNHHDDYTPVTVTCGNHMTVYKHKMHGWNILSTAFNNQLPVIVFSDEIRQHKKHFYPENQTEFLKHISWAYKRFNYCSTTFVHTENTDVIYPSANEFAQIITPASGTWFVDTISESPTHIIFYDYNQAALDYWAINSPVLSNVTYEFIKVDILTDDILALINNKEKKTLLNISNIFCYEGTAMFYSLEYRLEQELNLANRIPVNWSLIASNRSWSGFADNAKSIKELKKPTWHTNGDWND